MGFGYRRCVIDCKPNEKAVAMDKGLLIAGGLLAFALLKSKKASAPASVVSNQSGIWQDARLTEYHPDAPPDKQKLEGGPNDRMKHPVVTVQEHSSNKAKFPYVSVAADLVLGGERVKYGTRIYFCLLYTSPSPRD